MYCFSAIASGYFQERFDYSTVESGSIMSITYGVSVILCPIIGIITDKIGKRGFLLIASAIFLTTFHVLLIITPDSHKPIYPIFYFVLFGIGYSINVTVVWSAITYVLDKNIIGTAFGVAYCFSNMGLVIVPICIGYIQENTTKEHGYFWVSCFLAMLGIIGLFAAIFIFIFDLKHGGILHSSDPENALLLYQLQQSTIKDSFVTSAIN